MFFRDRADLIGTDRDVRHVNYRTTRLLLAHDPAPVSLTDITLEPGIKDTYGYPDRTEIAYCISGAASVVDLDSGTQQTIRPGVLWVAPAGSRFTFVASEPTRLICVFDPPLEGDETGIVQPR
jgi:L-ectoine synthase